MSAPAASRRPVLADDRAALAAGAAPGVADPVQPVAAQLGVVLPLFNGPDGDVVRHRTKYPVQPAIRQCIACGVLQPCDPALPCACCAASPFHLIPLAPRPA